jgi:hypothetical protein
MCRADKNFGPIHYHCVHEDENLPQVVFRPRGAGRALAGAQYCNRLSNLVYVNRFAENLSMRSLTLPGIGGHLRLSDNALKGWHMTMDFVFDALEQALYD